jgi:hypothetical protein
MLSTGVYRLLNYRKLSRISWRRRARSTGRDNTARATAPPRLEHAATETTRRGPRVKPNPALPEKAPEIYRERKPREELNGRKENIVQFIERVYAPWCEILTRADLRRLDVTAERAVENRINRGKEFPADLVPREFELNTARRRADGRRLSRLCAGLSATT